MAQRSRENLINALSDTALRTQSTDHKMHQQQERIARMMNAPFTANSSTAVS